MTTAELLGMWAEELTNTNGDHRVMIRALNSAAARLDRRNGTWEAPGSTDRDYGDEDPSWEVRDYTPALSDPFYG